MRRRSIAPPAVEIIRRPEITAGDIPAGITPAVGCIHPLALGASESQRGGTCADEIAAEVVAREDLLIGSRLDFLVDHRVPRRVGDWILSERVVRRDGCAVGEFLPGVARLQERKVAGEVVAAGDGHCAEPLLVCESAVVAGHSQGVHGCGGRVAGDEREGFVEVGVEIFGVVVVEGPEIVQGHVGARRYGIGNLGAKVEVVQKRAIVIYSYVRAQSMEKTKEGRHTRLGGKIHGAPDRAASSNNTIPGFRPISIQSQDPVVCRAPVEIRDVKLLLRFIAQSPIGYAGLDGIVALAHLRVLAQRAV